MTSSGPDLYAQSVIMRNQTVVTDERLMQPAEGHPAGADTDAPQPDLNVSVVVTSFESTQAALRRASVLARNLGARITLLVTQKVPQPLPLDTPPVAIDWNEERYQELAGQSPVETTVRIYLCRDRLTALKQALKDGSIVVVGCRRRWWPTTTTRLARQLRQLGHQVILAEQEGSDA